MEQHVQGRESIEWMLSRSRCYVQTHQVVCIKYVQIFVYQFYLNKALKKIQMLIFFTLGFHLEVLIGEISSGAHFEDTDS